MGTQEKYWDEKIKEWTRVSYGKKVSHVSLIERLANLFRDPITGRMAVALEIVRPKVKNKTILDMGCGLGDFCFAVLKYQPRKVIGIDLSGVAIKEAQKRAAKKKVGKKVKFIQGNVIGMKKLPKFDMAVGLGFIDYLNEEELKTLFRLFSGRYFFFSVFEKKLSLVNLIHAAYVKSQKCPGAFKYSREELRKIVPRNLKPYFLERDKMLFITNLRCFGKKQ